MGERAEYVFSLKNLFSTTLGKMQGDVNNFEGALGRAQGKADALGSSLKSALGLAGGIFLTKDIIETTAHMQSLTNSINATSRDAAEGASNLAFLDSNINRLGLSTEATYKGFKTLNAAVQGTSLQGEQTKKIFQQVSEASTVLGLSADDTEGVFLALGQMVSKGTVQAEELRGQLGERLPGAFQAAARAMGLTTKELGKQLQAGNILAEDLLPRLGNELEKMYKDKLGKSTESLQANLNRLNTEWLKFKVVIGSELIPVLIPLIHNIKDIAIALLSVWAAMKIISIGGFIQGLITATEAAGGLAAALEATGIAATVAWAAATLGLSLVIYGIIQLVRHFDEVKVWLTAFGEYNKELWSSIGEAIMVGLDPTRALEHATLAIQHWKKAMAIDKEYTDISEGKNNLSKTNSEWDRLASMAHNKDLGAGGTSGSNSKGSGGKGGTDVTKVEGQRPQNFYLQIDKLIEGGVNITTQVLKEGAAQAKDIVLKGLLEAANDVAIVQRAQ